MSCSRRRAVLAGAVAAAVSAASPASAAAQLYVAAGATATYTSLGSTDFEFPGAGFGIAGQARLGRGWVSVGVGGMAMNFPIEARSGDFDLRGVFVEPRLTIEGLDPDGQFTPYAFGRMSWLSQEGTLDGMPLTGEAQVTGGGAGVLLRVTPLLSIDFGGSYSSVELTGRTFDADARPDESGGGFGAHIGAYLRFGRSDGAVEVRSRRAARRPGSTAIAQRGALPAAAPGAR